MRFVVMVGLRPAAADPANSFWRTTPAECFALILHAGDEMFVDNSGKKIAANGKSARLNLLGGPWRASNFTYTEATWTKSLPDWIGWVNTLLIPHNLKSCVHKASFCDPEINHYGGMANH